MKPPSVSFSATSSVYSRIGYETVLGKREHSLDSLARSLSHTKPLNPEHFVQFRAEIMNLPRGAGTAALSSGSASEYGGVLYGEDDTPPPIGCYWTSSRYTGDSRESE